MDANETCACSAAPTLIFACSGAADVGAIADRAARKMTADGVGKMFCLAGVGGRVEPILKATAEATSILAIDGCPLDCVKACLQEVGFEAFRHVRVTDLGMEKGASPPTDQRVAQVADNGAAVLRT